MTIREIASLTKLAPSTVYRALKFPEKANNTVKEKIREVIGEIDINPNRLKHVYIILPQANAFYISFLVETIDLLLQNKIQAIPFICNEDHIKEKKFIDSIELSARIGLIWNPVDPTAMFPFLSRKKNKPPTIILNRELINHSVDLSILYANKEAVQLAVDTLAQNNSKNILFIGDYSFNKTASERKEEFIKIIQKHPHISFTILEADSLNWKHSYQIIHEHKELLMNHDAILSSSESIGYSILKLLKEMDIHIGKDIRFITFDHSPIFEALSISMIYFPTTLIAQKSVEYLLEKSKQPSLKLKHSIMPQLLLLGSERIMM